MTLVEKSVDAFVGTITLDHREKHNVLSSALISDLLESLTGLAKSGARVVILRAPRGAKVWSAGHDVRELPTNGRDPLTYHDPLRRVVRAIQEAPVPVIAMVEGGVWGGACELVMSCDMVVAAEGATFALTPAKLGVPYDIAGVLNFLRPVSLPRGPDRSDYATLEKNGETRATPAGVPRLKRVSDDGSPYEPEHWHPTPPRAARRSSCLAKAREKRNQCSPH